MIKLSASEVTAIFSAQIPGFKADQRGQWRGPATHRGGDNCSSLSVNVLKNAFFDHTRGEGGDSITFTQLVRNCDFVDACRFIAGLIGRSLLGDGSDPQRPRFTPTELSRAALFATGYTWHLEHQIELLQQLWLLDPAVVEAREMSNVTRLLMTARSWTPYEACEFLQLFLTSKNRRFVAGCIKEARDAQLELARVLSGIDTKEAVAA